MTNARGIDVSSYQPVLSREDIGSLDFVLCKATNGLSEVDPNFAANMAVIKAAGKIRGCYHELTTEPAFTQAGFFIDACKDHWQPEDILAVVASDYSGVNAAMVNTFCQRVRGVAPHNPVVVYTDKAVAPALGGCQHWPLWVADYGVPDPGDVAPWGTWHLWQYQGAIAPDDDVFNGTAADLRAWIASYQPKPPPAIQAVLTEETMPQLLPQTTDPIPLALPDNATGVRFCTNSATAVVFHVDTRSGKDTGWVEVSISYDGTYQVDKPDGSNGFVVHRSEAALLISYAVSGKS